MGIGFISIFLLKARVLNLTISKRKNLRLPLKVETDQFVFCLVLPECLSVKTCCTSPSDSEANRDGSDAESPFPLFFSLLRTLAREKTSENCLRFRTGGPSLCLYLLLSRNIIFCPALTMAARAKKKFWLSDLLTPSARECTIETFTITVEIHAHSLANFYCQYEDRHMNLKYMRRVSEREPAIRQFVIVKNKLMSVFIARGSTATLTML